MRPDLLLAGPLLAESFIARGGDVAAAWLLTYLVHSTVLLLAAWLVTSSSRMSDTVRDVVWKFALVGGLVTATVQMMVGREPLGGQLELASRTRVGAPPLRVTVRETPSLQHRSFMITSPRGTRWSAALVIVWLTGSGAALLWLTLGHARTLRVLGDRTSLDETSIRGRLDGLLERAGVRTPVALTSSGSIASPVALAGNEVCLPRRALFELTPNEQEGMLAHEVAHLVRRDPQWLVVARVIEMVLFMQPLNRLARHRLQEVAEFLCDDWAVSRVSQPVTLAKCLAAVAEWVGRAPRLPRLQPLSAMAESTGSPLVRRVGRILGARKAPGARTPRFAFAGGALALVALVAIAPRVSVAHASPKGGVMTVVRAFSSTEGGALRDSLMIVRREGVARIRIDTLVRHSGSVAAGAIESRPNLLFIGQPQRR